MKTDMEREKQEEEKMYADLWYADMQAKARREEMETQRQMSANRETLQILNKQMAALEAQKEEEKKLQDEEARLLVSRLERAKTHSVTKLDIHLSERCEKECTVIYNVLHRGN